jgi:biotin synthase
MRGDPVSFFSNNLVKVSDLIRHVKNRLQGHGMVDKKTTAEYQADRRSAVALLGSRGAALDALYARADGVRRSVMGDAVYIRGIIEFSNVCARNCDYCGIRAGNRQVKRYTLSADEIVATARQLPASGQTTVVLQSGESPAFGDEALGALIRRLKAETPLAVTISAGARPKDVYRYWRECGMDRYLIRFETSDPALYARMHPDSTLDQRLECIRNLKELGVQAGSGFMIGVPGETVEVLADNILLCRELDLDMIGIGPFISHPDTPLAEDRNAYAAEPEMFFKALAVLRIFNPSSHIPATTAYDAVFPGEGRNLALQRGANVFMPNCTPGRYRKDYLLYPGKPCIDESAEQCSACVLRRIESLGRTIGTGPGHSIKPPHRPPAGDVAG